MSAEQEARRDAAEAAPGRPIVLRVDPLVAQENLFAKLQQQVAPEKKVLQILQSLGEVESGPQHVMALVHVLMRQVVAGPLGYIIPPVGGARIVKDRVVQAATILLNVLAEETRRLEAQILQAAREGRDLDVEKLVARMIYMHHVAMIAIREVANRYLVLYSLNLPANLRPPLAEVKLGYDIVAPGER